MRNRKKTLFGVFSQNMAKRKKVSLHISIYIYIYIFIFIYCLIFTTYYLPLGDEEDDEEQEEFSLEKSWGSPPSFDGTAPRGNPGRRPGGSCSSGSPIAEPAGWRSLEDREEAEAEEEEVPEEVLLHLLLEESQGDAGSLRQSSRSALRAAPLETCSSRTCS